MNDLKLSLQLWIEAGKARQHRINALEEELSALRADFAIARTALELIAKDEGFYSDPASAALARLNLPASNTAALSEQKKKQG